MKNSMAVLLLILIGTQFIFVTLSPQALYQNTTSVVIHSDGSVTPSDGPLTRSGDTYTLTDDIYIPKTTNNGIIIEKDSVTLDGAGHKVIGHGEGSAIFLEKRTGVTIKNVLLSKFYWGLEMQSSTNCVVLNCNLTAVMYPIYLQSSSGNKFYHNNIYRIPYYQNSDNTWDNGYPSGGNYWEGYPYPDSKSGPKQDQPGSDGIGDVAVGEEIFSQGGANIDSYPLMKPQTYQAGTTSSLKIHIVDAQGNPIQGVTVESKTQPTGQSPLSGTTGVDGTAIFNDVKPGSYTFQASKSGSSIGSLTVNAGEGVTTDGSITTQPAQTTGSLKVTVKDKNGAALSGVSLSSTTQPSGQTTLTASTEADGTATFTGIRTGSYMIQASKSGYTQNSGQINVVSGDTNSLDITLQAISTGGDTSNTGGSSGVPGFPLEATAVGAILVIFLFSRRRKGAWTHIFEN